MQGKVRLSKRQIKEDKFTTFMLTSRNKLQENWHAFAIGGLALILVVFAIFYFVNAEKNLQINADAELAKAEIDYQRGNNLVAVTTLGRLVANYSGTPAAERATYLLGRINFDINNYPESQRYYEEYVSEYGSDPFKKAAALSGIAAIFENQSKNSEAAAKFDDAVAAYPGGPQVGDYLYGALRNYLAIGDMQSSQDRKESIEEKFPNSVVANRAILLFTEKGKVSAP